MLEAVIRVVGGGLGPALAATVPAVPSIIILLTILAAFEVVVLPVIMVVVATLRRAAALGTDIDAIDGIDGRSDSVHTLVLLGALSLKTGPQVSLHVFFEVSHGLF
jgi:hypothetical protein